MEEQQPFLIQSNRTTKWEAISSELRRVNYIALPMIVATVSQYLLRVSPMFMLGHVSNLALSSASIATSLCNVTGYGVLFGMASALETLCGQAYGAKQYRTVGRFTYGAILCLFVVCIPISILWIFTEKLLILVGLDPLISAEAGKFAILLIPTLFPYAILQSLVRYLQTQSVVFPMLWSSLASLCLQLLLCWAFVFKLNIGSSGAALSIGISYWFNVVLLLIYVKCSATCEKTNVQFSREVFTTVREFFQFAIPSAVMVCLEWWSFEIVILLSGLMPNPEQETSVLSICLTIFVLHYHIPYAFSTAASTLVSNELGAGKPEAARAALYAVFLLSVVECLIASVSVYLFRGILGYAFSNEKEIVNYVKDIAPLLCLSFIMDSSQTVLAGVARGSGWQHLGAYANLGAYYLVGIPVSLLLGFVGHLNGKGLWCGLVAGATVQALLLGVLTGLTNWEKQASEARGRIFAGNLPA